MFELPGKLRRCGPSIRMRAVNLVGNLGALISDHHEVGGGVLSRSQSRKHALPIKRPDGDEGDQPFSSLAMLLDKNQCCSLVRVEDGRESDSRHTWIRSVSIGRVRPRSACLLEPTALRERHDWPAFARLDLPARHFRVVGIRCLSRLPLVGAKLRKSHE